MAFDKLNRKSSPPTFEYSQHSIPKKLQKQPFWGLWSWVFKGKQWTKVPLNHQGQAADVAGFNLTFKAAIKLQNKLEASGVGYYFSPDNDQLGLDFDDCFTKKGKLQKEIKAIIKQLPGAYIETSVSGQGLHVVGNGARYINGVDEKIVFHKSRFFTFTGTGQGKLKDIGKKVNEIFAKKVRARKGGKSSGTVDVTELYSIVPRINPNLPEPEWFEVCKIIHAKSGGSTQGWNLFNAWSRGDMADDDNHCGTYEEKECLKRWDRCSTDKEALLGFPRLREILDEYGTAKAIDLEQFKRKTISLVSGNLHKRFLDVTHFPKCAAVDAAVEIARYCKIPIDPVLTSMLLVFSAAINKKVKFVERGALEYFCSMGGLISIESGGRKSAMDAFIMKPINAYEQKLVKEWNDQKWTNKALEASLKTQIKECHGMLLEDPADDRLLKRLAKLEKEKAGLKVKAPKMLEGDVTEEKLSDILHDNNETIFIQSDDARNVMKNITGRYDNTSENIYICGLTNNPYRRSRVKDNVEIMLAAPCINMMLKVQPDMLHKFIESRALNESGLMARLFIKSLNVDLAHQQHLDDDDVQLDHDIMKPYYQAMQQVLEYTGKQVLVKVDDDAAAAEYKKQNNRFASYMKPGARWDGFGNIVNKCTTLMMKVALVTKIMKDPDALDATKRGKFSLAYVGLSAKDIKRAAAIIDILISQSVEVAQGFEADGEIKGAQWLLNKMLDDRQRLGTETWSWSDIRNKFSAKSRQSAERWLGVLQEEGIVVKNGANYEINFEGVE